MDGRISNGEDKNGVFVPENGVFVSTSSLQAHVGQVKEGNLIASYMDGYMLSRESFHKAILATVDLSYLRLILRLPALIFTSVPQNNFKTIEGFKGRTGDVTFQNCGHPGSSKVRSGHLRFFHGIAFHQWRPQVD